MRRLASAFTVASIQDLGATISFITHHRDVVSTTYFDACAYKEIGLYALVMTESDLIDAVVRELGFKSGARLGAALGRNRQSVCNWRRTGLPRLIIVDLLALSERMERPFSDEIRVELSDRLFVKSQPNVE